MEARWLLRVAFLIGAWASSAAAQQPLPVGLEFRVNSYTTGRQRFPSVASNSGGDFVVVWTGAQDQADGIFGQRYAASGDSAGTELHLNSYTSNIEELPSVGMDGAGRFVAAWEGAGQDGSARGIFGQRFDASGAPAGPEFQVNTYTTSDQQRVSVAVGDNGDFVVVWRSSFQDGYGDGVFAQRFMSTGLLAGSEFRVNATTTGSQDTPAVAMDGAGNFFVVWASGNQDGSSTGVFGQRFDASGGPLGPEFQVNTYTTDRQDDPAVAMGPGGEFVVVWSSRQHPYGFYGIHAQRFGSGGAPLGTELHVNTSPVGGGAGPSVATDSAGRFVVVWTYFPNFLPPKSEVFGQAFDSGGTRLGTEFQINTFTIDRQENAAISASAGGVFTVVWNSYGQEEPTDPSGVFGQRFVLTSSSTPPPTPSASPTPTGTPTPSASPTPTGEPAITPTSLAVTPTATLVEACTIVEGPFVSRNSTTAIISWRTNVDSDGAVSSVGEPSFPPASDLDVGREHEITLNGLSALTVYDYQVDSDCDPGVSRAARGTAARRGSFTTRPIGPPEIVEGPDVPVFAIGTGSAVVVWRTDIPADARVDFGLDTNYGTVIQSADLREEHLVLLEGLTPGQTYHYRVESCDAFGGCIQGEDQSFEAAPAPGDGLPLIVQKDPVEELDVTDRSAFIRWVTDEPATSAVEFGREPGLESVATSDGLALDHRFLLTGLLAGTSYCHRVVSADAEDNSVASGVSCFTTDALPDGVPPVLVDLGGRRTTRAVPEVTYVTDDRFVLEWQTAEPASAELFVDPVLRGTGGEAWLSSGVRKRFSANVRVRPNRRGAGTYRYTLRLTDVEANTSVFESPQGSVITLQKDTTAPVLSGQVRLSAARSNRVVLEWTTDEASDTRARVEVNGNPTGRRWLDPEPSRRHRLELTRLGGLQRPFEVVVQSCNLEGLCMQEETLSVDEGLFVGALDARGLGAVLLGLGLAGVCLLRSAQLRDEQPLERTPA